MAHPIREEAADSHNAKLRRMTRHYGEANPAMNIKTPQEKMKIEGPEPHQGFGTDYAAVNARSDKPARKALAANPVATYKRGGAAYCEGGMAKRARGGRMKHHGKGATHVNVVVAPQGAGAQPPMAPPPQLAALAAQKPPMPPAPPVAPPMGAGPMGPPPGAPPMMPRKRGGKVHADEAQDKALIHKELKAEGLIRKRADGGAVGSRGEGGKKLKVPKYEGGVASGPGREDNNEHWARHGKKTKQEV